MRNYFNSMKKVKFSLFFLLSVFGLCAQSPILVLEAENSYKYAESNPELEMNEKVQSQWQYFERQQHKRRRAYTKKI